MSWLGQALGFVQNIKSMQVVQAHLLKLSDIDWNNTKGSKSINIQLNIDLNLNLTNWGSRQTRIQSKTKIKLSIAKQLDLIL